MTSILSLCHWLQHTEFSQAVLQSSLVFPLIEGTHILALSISVGLVMVLDLRLLGLAFRGERVAIIRKQSAGLSMAGFALMFATGIILFITQAEKAYTNRFFLIKMVLLLLAGINAAWYQYKYYPNMDEWDAAPTTPLGPRVCAVVSLICWITVIFCGRTMAYEF
jgi:hypothetical protein